MSCVRITADSWRLLHLLHCEIPAYAGMVFRGTGIYRRIRHCRRPPPHCRPHNRQIRPHTPVLHETIPAKAGISQCRVRTVAISPTILRPQSRPFLRRQESHNIVWQIIAKIYMLCGTKKHVCTRIKFVKLGFWRRNCV